MKKICNRKSCKAMGQKNITNRIIYCFKCYRFKQMINRAQRSNQYVPTWEELKLIFPGNMICPTCNKKMILHASLGLLGDVISLQHNNDGSIILICHSCNTGHGHSQLGDDYFKIPSDKKYCSKCKKTLYRNQFYKSTTKRDGLQNQCQKCQTLYNKERKSTCQKI